MHTERRNGSVLSLPLEPTDDRADPAFKNAASCLQWLGQLQLTNLHAAHGTLRRQLDEFNRYPMSGFERLQTLELLRETVSVVQADYAKKLVAKKLPLSNEELAILVSIIGLWQGMITGYQRCLQAYVTGDRQLVQPGAAMLCQRCLFYSGMQIYEHLRVGYEFDGKLWQQLHALYEFSEEHNLHLVKIPDTLSENTHRTTCRAAYVKLLLTYRAYRADLTRTQLKLLDRWLSQWSMDIAVDRHYARSRGDAPPLAVDLDSPYGLQPLEQINHQGNVRYLAMVPLSKLLRVKIILLQQGQSPQQLELGEDCSRTDCAEFLNSLLQCWCEERSERMAKRSSETKLAHVCYGIESCYAYTSSKPFKQPAKSGSTDAAARKQIETFGRVLTPTAGGHGLAEMGFVLETWQIQDESILGVSMLREGAAGERLNSGQLVAVRTTGSVSFVLGAINWMKVTQTGQLLAGIHYFPGIPQAVAMKASGINVGSSDKSVAALLLPPMDSLSIPASLIAPRDWFKPQRMVELTFADNQKMNIRMEFSVEKGLDFERISFTKI